MLSGRPLSAASIRSRSGGLVSMVLATRRRAPRSSSTSPSPQPHAVAVAVGVGALVGVAAGRRVAHLAQDDHARRAPVDAQGATGAHSTSATGDNVVGGIDARLLDLD